MATNLNLSTIELESTLRPFPENGAPGSQDYNDSMIEILTDLATITEYANDTLVPLLNSLAAAAMLPANSPVGIEGRTIFSDSSNQTPLFFNTASATPLTIAQTIGILNGMIQSLSTTVTNLGIQVTTLSSQLSISNQNSMAQQINSITASVNSLSASVAALQALSATGHTGTVTVGTQTLTLMNGLITGVSG